MRRERYGERLLEQRREHTERWYDLIEPAASRMDRGGAARSSSGGRMTRERGKRRALILSDDALSRLRQPRTRCYGKNDEAECDRDRLPGQRLLYT